MAKDFSLIRNAFKFAVQTMLNGTPGNILQGVEAISAMHGQHWPDVKWQDRIAMIPPKPKMFLAPGVDNPNFVQEYLEWKNNLETQRQSYLAALQGQYPTVRFILMAYNTKLGWFQVTDNKSDSQWLAFINRTILWTDKERIMRSMVGLKSA